MRVDHAIARVQKLDGARVEIGRRANRLHRVDIEAPQRRDELDESTGRWSTRLVSGRVDAARVSILRESKEEILLLEARPVNVDVPRFPRRVGR
tara:strand:- start:201 stop:482 length:282 start_codon:yes stop_codon:yes gene_type:complete